MQKHVLTIRPALEPIERHKIEYELIAMGYDIIGGGTRTDMSECDITFEKFKKEESYDKKAE